MVKKLAYIFAILVLLVWEFSPFQLSVKVAHADFTSNLVGHWKLDEGTGTNAADSIGSANGTLSATSPTWVTGQIGPYALNSTTGDPANVDMGAWTLFDGASAVTTSLWINPAYTHNGTLFSTGSTFTGNGMRMYDTSSSNSFLCSVWASTGLIQAAYDYTSDGAPTGWFMLTCTFDGTNVTLYKDGVQKATAAGTAGTIKPATHNFYLFDDRADFLNGFYGSEDDVCFYSRVLTSTDITDLFNSSTGCTASGGGGTATPDANNFMTFQ